MTFIDFFAGIGGFRRGMELAGHKCVGFCEYDRFAVMSYTTMHLAAPEQLQYISKIPAPLKKNGGRNLNKRQKEILKDEYRNGEWYAKDVRSIDINSIPKSDCWCFGFPCQDISIAGKGIGFRGKRSSLFFAVTKLVRELKEENRPRYLFIENVKNLLSVNGGFDFARLLIELDEIGYDAEWQVLNSKDFYVPQNRERVFIIGHLRRKRTSEVFPLEGTGGENCSELELFGCVGGRNSQRNRIYGTDGISPTISTCSGGNTEIKVAIPIFRDGNQSKIMVSGIYTAVSKDFDRGGLTGLSRTIKANKHDAGVTDGYTIRKLTPKECFRLQGWIDDYYEKAALVNSDSQLYKQAGNGVTVNVIQAVGERMK